MTERLPHQIATFGVILYRVSTREYYHSAARFAGRTPILAAI